MYPRLVVDLEKLRFNAERLIGLSREKGIELALVTKVFCAERPMVEALAGLDFPYFADSRVQNLATYGDLGHRRLLLRLPMPGEVEETVKNCDLSFNSEPATLLALDAAAARLNKRHSVVLMIDLGDLREGIFFERFDEILAAARLVESCENLELAGTAFNLTCYGAILPSERNLGVFMDITEKIERELGRRFEFISGGNSSSLPMLEAGLLPERINNLRLGESMVLGNETAGCRPFLDLHTDVVTLEAELVEVKLKPSAPIGESGANAFGESAAIPDIGPRLRAIAAVGRQDVDQAGLEPLEKGMSIVGASSDHLILDLTDCERNLSVGDRVAFKLSYGAVLRAFTSRYVSKTYINN